MHRQILERALSDEVITPGVTTLGEVGWWVQEQLGQTRPADRLFDGYQVSQDSVFRKISGC